MFELSTRRIFGCAEDCGSEQEKKSCWFSVLQNVTGHPVNYVRLHYHTYIILGHTKSFSDTLHKTVAWDWIPPIRYKLLWFHSLRTRSVVFSLTRLKLFGWCAEIERLFCEVEATDIAAALTWVTLAFKIDHVRWKNMVIQPLLSFLANSSIFSEML